MIFIAFFCGFALCFIFFIVSYLVLRELIFKYGKFITRKLENEINLFDEATKDGTEIIYPDETREIFDKEDSQIEDLLKE